MLGDGSCEARGGNGFVFASGSGLTFAIRVTTQTHRISYRVPADWGWEGEERDVGGR